MSARHDLTPPPERSLRRRWWLLLLACLVFVIAVIAGGLTLVFKLAEADAQKELDSVIAAMDAADPHWRLEDIEAARKVIPDKENAALVIMAIADHLPKPFPGRPPRDELSDHETKDLYDRISEVALQDDLEPDLFWDMRLELSRAQPLLKDARSLVRLSEGRYPITYSKDYFSTRLKCEDSRTVIGLLKMDALVRAREYDIDGALTSTGAALVAARSVGDEPLKVSQLVRTSCGSHSLWILERTLAQGEGSEPTLEGLQKLLEEEETAPLLWWCAYGERAGQHKLMIALEDGSISLGQLGGHSPDEAPSRLREAWARFSGGAMLRRSHAAILRWMNEYVEATKSPPEELAKRLAVLAKADTDQTIPIMARLMIMPTLFKGDFTLPAQARCRCAIVALASERFRLAKGSWPKELAELVPGFLKQVPTDPYDGKPLRFRAVADGLAIYSIGPDRQDDGGKVDREKPLGPGTDIVFRLWNVDARRQPARNPDVGPPRPPAREEPD